MRSGAPFSRSAPLLCLAALALLPGVATAARYEVSSHAITYTPLPIAEPGAGELRVFDPDGLTAPSSPAGSADARLPFPVRFFDELYTEASVSTFGYLTFGPRTSARCVDGFPNCAHQSANQPIPSTKQPNRLIAAWWDNLNVGNSGVLRAQVLGAAPGRRYVIEWSTLGIPLDWRERVNVQLWLTEGSSTLELRYGSASGPTGVSAFSASVGIESPVDGGTVEGVTALGCTPTCSRSHWPTNTAIVFAQGPDLELRSIAAPAFGTLGGSLHLEATVANAGGREAGSFPVSFSLSRSAELDGSAIPLGTSEESLAPLAPQASRRFALDAPVPKDLEPGAWYVIARADPAEIIPQSGRRNDVLVSGPLILEEVGALLQVVRVEAPSSLAPDSRFVLRWTARNSGSVDLIDVPYAIALTATSSVGPANRRLYEGRLSLALEGEEEELVEIDLPDDVPEGRWYLGVVIDPDVELPSLDHQQNTGVSEPVLVRSTGLRIVTGELPPAVLGSSWCMRLDAAGGDGSYRWSMVPGWALPPGLALKELPAGAREAGLPFLTRLCGRPTSVGSFDFRLEVRSGSLTSDGALHLDVQPEGLPLRIATAELPAASFRVPYEARLAVAGGMAPYVWTLSTSGLPAGLGLRSDGVLLGAALEDGSFPIGILVEDAAGAVSEQELELLVTSPSRLSCVTTALPPRQVGDPFSEQLLAAGGLKPYRWRSVETRRLPSRPGESSPVLGSTPPPGLSLSGSGAIAGTASEVGEYVWTVEVLDLAQVPAIASCTIGLQVREDRGLTITSQAIAPAVAGSAYRTQLEAMGGDGRLVWRLSAGSRLPAGLALSPGGVIEGTPTPDSLEGEGERTFAFSVEVRDPANRYAIAPIGLELLAESRTTPVPASEPASTGCAAQGKDLGGLGLLLLPLALMESRRLRQRRHGK